MKILSWIITAVIYPICQTYMIVNEIKKGCLKGKTKEQKHDFFIELTKFQTLDPEFYWDQITDLENWEKWQYIRWLQAQDKDIEFISILTQKIQEIKQNTLQL
ncbi:MAG: hypothetical protein AB7U05_09115 [Mangrovibacterium sp.]